MIPISWRRLAGFVESGVDFLLAAAYAGQEACCGGCHPFLFPLALMPQRGAPGPPQRDLPSWRCLFRPCEILQGQGEVRAVTIVATACARVHPLVWRRLERGDVIVALLLEMAASMPAAEMRGLTVQISAVPAYVFRRITHFTPSWPVRSVLPFRVRVAKSFDTHDIAADPASRRVSRSPTGRECWCGMAASFSNRGD